MKLTKRIKTTRQASRRKKFAALARYYETIDRLLNRSWFKRLVL